MAPLMHSPRFRVLLLAIAALCASLLLFALPLVHARMLRVPLVAVRATRDFKQAVEADSHEYFRPPRTQTSGFPNSTATYHRAPCPCLNTLANHGYLPRDGKNVTPQMVKQAIVDVFNIAPSLADTLTSPLKPVFTLSDLSEHNFIEHDASLVHNDEYFQTDPSEVNVTMADDLFARAEKATEGVITKRVLAHFRAARERDSEKIDPEYSFSAKLQASAYAEAAAFLLGMGDYDSETISVADARSFLVDEQIPQGWKRSETTITTSVALYVAAKIKFLASFPWFVAAVE
uniref:Heme haloperoxidase family profile domain-containing protein n=1 Tax=Globisporangium ultimum (strain ATCC 200006 / CBS 805.95 / DAOM BR144) TaxID=431595 RepID=K3WVQ8_GLOUD